MSNVQQVMSEYEKIRNQIVAERKDEWQKLLGAKEDYDQQIEKKAKQVKRHPVIQNVTPRRSLRKRPVVSYIEDSSGTKKQNNSSQPKRMLHIKNEIPRFDNSQNSCKRVV